MDEELRCGALLSPADENDLIVEDLAGIGVGSDAPKIELPVVFNCDLVTEVRNQGNRETCASFVGATLLEFKSREHMSPEFIYSKRVNKPSDGMYGRDMMSILLKHGSVPERYQPYGDLVERDHPEEIKVKVKGYAKVQTIDGLKHSLVNSGPCYVALPYRGGENKFWLSKPNKPQKTLGYHAVTIVGYTLTGFTIRNSWGLGFADAGHVELPYEEFDHIAECWAVIF